MSSKFDEIRERYDLTALIEQSTGQQAVHGNKFRCLFHDDHTPSMVVYPDGKFYCFGCCARGDTADILAKLWGCDLRDVVDRIEDMVPTMRPYAPRTAAPLVRTFTEDMVRGYEDRLGERELGVWRDMGIPAAPLYRLRVGYENQRFVFPWFYRGDPIAFKLRRDDTVAPHLEPKYTSKTGSKYDVPYNVDVLATNPDTICIYEDERSVIASTTCGVAGIAAPANAWKPQWSQLLAAVSKLIVVADNDEPGIAGAQKIKNTLARAMVVVAPFGKDAFDYYRYLRDQTGDLVASIWGFRDWLELPNDM